MTRKKEKEKNEERERETGNVSNLQPYIRITRRHETRVNQKHTYIYPTLQLKTGPTPQYNRFKEPIRRTLVNARPEESSLTPLGVITTERYKRPEATAEVF